MGAAVRQKVLERSLLAVPATSTARVEKAAQSEADAVFLDLEDAVAPDRKSYARGEAVFALERHDWGRKLVSVRINGLDTPDALEDLNALVSCARLDTIMVPKVETADDVRFIDRLLAMLEQSSSREVPLGLDLLIETASGVGEIEAICRAVSRTQSIVFGVGDYAVNMGLLDLSIDRYAVLDPEQTARPRHWNDQWHYALARVANACRAAGVRAIDTVFMNLDDEAGFQASAERGLALGFEGKLVIHPRQIPIANERFSPTAAQEMWAREILSAMDEAEARGSGAINLRGALVDQAHTRLAHSILERVALIQSAKTESAR
jgi:malyl-CoA/(S)-citramalyl-CoA lyase